MKKYITLLRGINVNGKNIIKMLDLKIMFEELGFLNVKTYLQSGNIVFESKLNDIALIQTKIADKIKNKLNLDISVLVLNQYELIKIYENNPFLRDKNLDHLYYTFSFSETNELLVEEIRKKAEGEEDFTLDKNIIYLYCPYGYGKTKLNNTFIENKLKMKCTTRNFKTVKSLIDL